MSYNITRQYFDKLAYREVGIYLFVYRSSVKNAKCIGQWIFSPSKLGDTNIAQ